MPVWTVHAKAADPAVLRTRADTVRFVREGFNWPAFLVPLLWLVIKGMWVVLLISLAFEFAIMAIGEAGKLSGFTQTTLSIALNLVMGFAGNDLYRWSLARGGYHEIGLASGSDIDEAELRFFMALPQSAPQVSPKVAPPSPLLPDALGLFPEPRPAG
jgi:Protein of unknown function (DUF2628)